MRDSHVELTRALEVERSTVRLMQRQQMREWEALREARLEIDRGLVREAVLAQRIAELEIECDANREFIAHLAMNGNG
jgi:hypothetical protein